MENLKELIGRDKRLLMKRKTCTTPDCHKEAGKKSSYCHTCRHRREKEKDPQAYTYGVLRRNARRRGISFELSFKEFLQFACRTEYLIGKGRTAEGLTIDRIDTGQGYKADNIQALTCSDNARKEIERRKLLLYEHERGGVFYKTLRESIACPDCPF
jgi:hypothetical protein